MAEGIHRITSEDDPERCQSVGRERGQCNNKRTPGSDYCLLHGGNKGQGVEAVAAVRNYQLTKFQAELERHSDMSTLKSLRNEVGILRMTLETLLNRCNDSNDLIMNSITISNLVGQIEKLVSSCHKLEGQMGQTLDKQQLMQFASQIVGIISNNLVGQEKLVGQIADEIINLLKE